MMEFPENIILENERVLLRPLEKTDIQFLVSLPNNEPETWQFSPVPMNGEDGMKTYIDATINQRLEKKEYPFIVFDKSENRYAGCTRFYEIQLQNLATQLGYTW